eukprot:6178775-Pleurochrysis_carterae.AAC.7
MIRCTCYYPIPARPGRIVPLIRLSSSQATASWLTRRPSLLSLGWAPRPIGHPCPPPLSAPWLRLVCARGVAERAPSQSLRDGRVGGADATPAAARGALPPPPVLTPPSALAPDPRLVCCDKGEGGRGEPCARLLARCLRHCARAFAGVLGYVPGCT